MAAWKEERLKNRRKLQVPDPDRAQSPA